MKKKIYRDAKGKFCSEKKFKQIQARKAKAKVKKNVKK